MQPQPQFVTDGHLGGYIKATPEYPHGDPATWCPGVWDWAIKTFEPAFVLDVGCGEGHAVRYFEEKGIGALGIDGLAKQADYRHDYTKGSLPVDALHPSYFPDLIWCCEFVEHIEEQYVENFLTTFDRAKKVVLMTHAFPGQQGWHHVNCQYPSYWIGKMTVRGWQYSATLTYISRPLAPGTHWQRSGLVFVKDV